MLIRSSGYFSTFLLSLIILFISQDLIVPLSIFHREYQVLIVSLRLITREKRRLSRFRIIIDHTSPNQSIVQYLCNCFHLQFLIFQITIWIIETKLGENFYRNYILSKIWLRITVIIFINVIQCSCFNRIMIRVSLVSINRGSLNKRKSFVHLHVRNFIRTNFP